MRKAVSVVGLCLALISSQLVWAQAPPREEARAHFAAGETRFKAGDYQGAIDEFQAADKLVPSPLLTYNVALCYDKMGNATQALTMYKLYLDRRPDAPNRPTVEARIAALAASEPPIATTPPAPLFRGPAPEGDGLAKPAAPSTEPQKRPYDDTFARRLPSHGDAEQVPPTPAPNRVPPPPEPQPPPPNRPETAVAAAGETPLYKQWWFWALVGVGTFIVIDVAVNAGSSNSPPRTQQNGLTVFHF